MRQTILYLVFLLAIAFTACKKDNPAPDNTTAYRTTKRIQYNNIGVDVVIDKPVGTTFDVLVVYHGTVMYDSLILNAAINTLDGFKRILDRQDMLVISVAYPEENLLMGDNLVQAEAGLLWVKNKAAQELGITINKIFLAGHSQGGYLVTMLNTLHATNGVVANAPGPLNMVYRCQLEENGTLQSGEHCTRLRNMYGTTAINPDAYFQRSLLNFVSNYRSPILFVQGMSDSPIQMYSWPIFKQQVSQCTNCTENIFLEIPGLGHQSLFQSADGKTVFNAFINNH